MQLVHYLKKPRCHLNNFAYNQYNFHYIKNKIHTNSSRIHQDMSEYTKMLKNTLKDALAKDKLENIMLNISMLSDKITNLESKILSIERDNEDLKVALGNLSIAYLELIKSFPLPQDFMTAKTTNERFRPGNILT